MSVLVVLSTLASAAPAKHAAYLELGGSGIIYTANYERRLGQHVAVSAGLGGLGLREPATQTSFGWAIQPWRVHGLLGSRGHHLEASLGFAWGLMRGDVNEPGRPRNFWLVHGTSSLGYRFQPDDGGFVFRAAVTPFYGGGRFAPLGAALQPWAGVSLGWAWGASTPTARARSAQRAP